MTTLVEPARPSALDTARLWSRHLLGLVLPLTCLAFLATAPHPWWAALPWVMVVVLSIVADFRSAPETEQPHPALPSWPFDGMLYGLVALQFVNVALFVRMVAVHGFWTADTLVGWQLVGITSGYSGIVVAHELIHRHEKRFQWLGRGLLGLVLYEHFYTEHIRGHHVRVATGDDPATARFGETAEQHFVRTVPQQLASAWRLETKRLGDEHMKPWDPRIVRSRVFQGLVAEWGVAFAILAFLGIGPFVAFVGQAFIAVRLLEAVNYFEHWGLERRGPRPTTIDSWDTSSRFTLYTLVGLSRHADHHAHASRPYQQLRHFEESPKLPWGYFGSVVMAVFKNRAFQRAMTAELERRQLGPFAVDAPAVAARAA